MRSSRFRRPLLVGLGGLVLALASEDGRANSRIMGIPNECTMTTFEVALPTAPGETKTPIKLASTSMMGAWAVRAFHMAPDGRRIVHLQFNGILLGTGTEAAKDYKVNAVSKAVQWSPDSRKFIFWVGEGMAIADADAPGEAGGPLKVNVLTKGRPANAGWAPDGSGIYLLGNVPAAPGKPPEGSLLQKVSTSGAVTEVLRSAEPLLYFALPTARFEYGAGPSAEPFSFVLGGKDALYLASGSGGEKQKLRDFKPDGLQDLVLSPDSKKGKLLLRMAKDQATADGKTVLRGILLAHIDRWSAGKTLELEPLYAKNDAHTIWFSPSGKYATWASTDTVGFREVDGKPGSEVTVPLTEKGMVKGCRWDRSESRLAITAANHVYVYEVATKKLTLVADLGTEAGSFVADPVWRGDDVVFTQFVDTGNK